MGHDVAAERAALSIKGVYQLRVFFAYNRDYL